MKCRSCGGNVSDRYAPYGVCQSCYGTTDDVHDRTADGYCWCSPVVEIRGDSTLVIHRDELDRLGIDQ